MLAYSPTIRLRPLQASDFADFYAYRSDPDLCRYQDFEPFSEAKARDFIEKYNSVDLSKVGEWMQIGIEGIAQGRLIGDCAIMFWEEEPRIVEVGVTLAPQYQGQGLATQSMELLLQMLFTQTPTHKVMAYIDVRNTASIRLVERLNLQLEGRARKAYFDTIDQDWYDEFQYAILREDLIPPT